MQIAPTLAPTLAVPLTWVRTLVRRSLRRGFWALPRAIRHTVLRRSFNLRESERAAVDSVRLASSVDGYLAAMQLVGLRPDVVLALNVGEFAALRGAVGAQS